MKNRVKKLTLNRETLADLELRQTAAGAVRTGYPFPCPYSGQNTCATCQFTCTSNYC
jgi:hypothetical protein